MALIVPYQILNTRGKILKVRKNKQTYQSGFFTSALEIGLI